MKIFVLNKNDDLRQVIKDIDKDNQEEIVLKLPAGKYEGPITIDRPNITLEGKDPLTSIITGSLAACEIMPDGIKRGTFRTQTLFIDAYNIKLKNITVENTAGVGEMVGQAIALYADGDNLKFENCRFLGHQDTIFAAPLPEKEVEPGGFRGPKEKAPRRMSRQSYKDCYIEGDVDFIFGGGRVFFENCEIFALKRDKGYITAASTPESEKYGFVFYKCRFNSDSAAGSYYLGRPWRENAKTILIECELGSHINKKGWHDWNNRGESGGVFYAEYASKGKGAAPEERAAFSRQLEPEEARNICEEFGSYTLE